MFCSSVLLVTGCRCLLSTSTYIHPTILSLFLYCIERLWCVIVFVTLCCSYWSVYYRTPRLFRHFSDDVILLCDENRFMYILVLCSVKPVQAGSATITSNFLCTTIPVCATVTNTHIHICLNFAASPEFSTTTSSILYDQFTLCPPFPRSWETNTLKWTQRDSFTLIFVRTALLMLILPYILLPDNSVYI